MDAHVGISLFQGAILPLVRKGKTVILVTHALHFLCHCDYIYTLQEGRVAEHGTYDDLVAHKGEFAHLVSEFGGVKTPETDDSPQPPEDAPKAHGKGTGRLEGRLIVKENRDVGSVSWQGESPLHRLSVLLAHVGVQSTLTT